MQYPGTPSSGYSDRSPPFRAPNAPYMNPRDLPPTPPTPTSSLSGRGHPSSSPYAALPTATSHNSSYGLMTPPTSPERLLGAGATVQLHQLLRASARVPLYCNIALPLERIQFSTSYGTRTLAEPAMHPPTAVLILNVIDVFTVEVRSPHGAGLSVGDVLGTLMLEMGKQPQQRELTCFPPEVQDSVMRGSIARSQGRTQAPAPYVRRVDLLGPRLIFGGLELRQLANGVAFCDVRLSSGTR